MIKKIVAILTLLFKKEYILITRHKKGYNFDISMKTVNACEAIGSASNIIIADILEKNMVYEMDAAVEEAKNIITHG